MSLYAGQAGTIDYYPNFGGNAWDPVDHGGTVDRFRLYPTSDRTGTPTVDVSGSTKIGFGDYRFTVPAITLAGVYYARVDWTPSTGATQANDVNDTVTVLPAGGGFTQGLITLTQAKTYIRKTTPTLTSPDDGLIQEFIDATTPIIQDLCRDQLIAGTFVEHYDAGASIYLRKRPVTQIISIIDRSSQSVYELESLELSDGGRVRRRRHILLGTVMQDATWGRVDYLPFPGAVTVTYTAGLSSVPANVVQAAKVVVGHMWQSQMASIGGASNPSDGMVMTPSGYMVPNRAVQALGPNRRGARVG